MEEKLFKSILILATSFFLSWFLPRLIHLPQHIYERPKIKTVMRFIKHAISAVIYFLAILILLNIYGIDMTPYLLSSSIIGFAVGFGAQNLIKDLIAGINLLLEPEFRIGREIKIGETKGILENITLKNTYIVSKNGDFHIIPNGEIKTITISAEKTT